MRTLGGGSEHHRTRRLSVSQIYPHIWGRQVDTLLKAMARIYILKTQSYKTYTRRGKGEVA
jgi:hypothetical protein